MLCSSTLVWTETDKHAQYTHHRNFHFPGISGLVGRPFMFFHHLFLSCPTSRDKLKTFYDLHDSMKSYEI